jgi:hypothetical protein
VTALGAVVLAHRDPPHVQRLIRALGDVPVVLHCDSKAAPEVAAEMVAGAGPNVSTLPRTSGALNSWSLVRIELAGLRAVLARSAVSHVAVISGSDYPLVGPDELHERLEAWVDRSYLLSVPIPFQPWSTPRHPDGGRWRTAHRFLTRGDDLISVRGIPARLPWRRSLPPGLQLRASSQWKVYARRDVELLLRVVDTRPDLVRFWRSTLVPDESFAASVLSSPAITGESALPLCHDVPWYTHWPRRGAHHPSWLDLTHFDDLALHSRATPGAPVELERERGSTGLRQAWFGRKFSTGVSSALLDRIDAELRRAAEGQGL